MDPMPLLSLSRGANTPHMTVNHVHRQLCLFGADLLARSHEPLQDPEKYRLSGNVVHFLCGPIVSPWGGSGYSQLL
jgi:hypothetical protein